jgi:hypothetical protein
MSKEKQIYDEDFSKFHAGAEVFLTYNIGHFLHLTY